jgi:hypothetical protein
LIKHLNKFILFNPEFGRKIINYRIFGCEKIVDFNDKHPQFFDKAIEHNSHFEIIEETYRDRNSIYLHVRRNRGEEDIDIRMIEPNRPIHIIYEDDDTENDDDYMDVVVDE